MLKKKKKKNSVREENAVDRKERLRLSSPVSSIHQALENQALPLMGNVGQGLVNSSHGHIIIPWAEPTLGNKGLSAGTQIWRGQLGLGRRASASDFC